LITSKIDLGLMQTEKSKRKYVSFWMKIIYFLIRFEESHLENQEVIKFKFNRHIKSLAMSVLDCCDEKSVFELLSALLTEERGCNDFTTLILAERLRIVLPEGKIRSQTTIQNELSMLIYLMKFSFVMHCWSAEIGKDNAFKLMNHLRHLQNPLIGLLLLPNGHGICRVWVFGMTPKQSKQLSCDTLEGVICKDDL
jgi:hypothetical protein